MLAAPADEIGRLLGVFLTMQNPDPYQNSDLTWIQRTAVLRYLSLSHQFGGCSLINIIARQIPIIPHGFNQ